MLRPEILQFRILILPIDLVNGNIFGLAVGYKNNQDQILGGTVSVDNSVIRCNTDTDSGEKSNHNMLFLQYDK